MAYTLASVFGVTLAVTASYLPVTVEVKPIRVSRMCMMWKATRAWCLRRKGFNANAGFVVTYAGVVVFDALGTAALGQKLIEVIRSESPHNPTSV